jgi:hypothetical protein
MMSTRFVHNNIHVGFLLILFSHVQDIQLLKLNHYAYVTYNTFWKLDVYNYKWT